VCLENVIGARRRIAANCLQREAYGREYEEGARRSDPILRHAETEIMGEQR